MGTAAGSWTDRLEHRHMQWCCGGCCHMTFWQEKRPCNQQTLHQALACHLGISITMSMGNPGLLWRQHQPQTCTFPSSAASSSCTLRRTSAAAAASTRHVPAPCVCGRPHGESAALQLPDHAALNCLGCKRGMHGGASASAGSIGRAPHQAPHTPQHALLNRTALTKPSGARPQHTIHKVHVGPAMPRTLQAAWHHQQHAA